MPGRLRTPPSAHQIVAEADAAAKRSKPQPVCDVCGKPLEGEPAGRGLLLWTRGDEVRAEEPALCEKCAPAITAAGGMMWASDDEED
jgi:hypothetical protein